MSISQQTRREAYYDIIPERPTRKWFIIQILKHAPDGMTADEVLEELMRSWNIRDWNVNFCRPRLTELVEDGMVEVVGRRRSAKTGKMMGVYRLKEGFYGRTESE